MNRTDHIKLNWFHKTLNCHNCGHHEDLPLPMPVAEAAERINEFSMKHQDCPKQAMLDLDDDGDTIPWKSQREIELEERLAFEKSNNTTLRGQKLRALEAFDKIVAELSLLAENAAYFKDDAALARARAFRQAAEIVTTNKAKAEVRS